MVKIIFKVNLSSPSDLEAGIGKEGLGWSKEIDEQDCTASLEKDESGRSAWKVWEGYSSATYTLSSSTPIGDGRCEERWEYKGDLELFRAHLLLPQGIARPLTRGGDNWWKDANEGIEVVSVEGTYGSYHEKHTRDPLRAYHLFEKAWQDKCRDLFEKAEGTLFSTSGWGFEEFCNYMWQIRKNWEGCDKQPEINPYISPARALEK